MDYDYLIEHVDDSDLILDVGTKNGKVMDQLNGRTISIDISFNSTDSDTEYAYADGTSLPFRSKKFDYILCNQVIEHISDTEGLVKELSRVLKDNGEAIVTFPNRLAPTAPHLTPWWFSYLPKAIGRWLAPHVLNEEKATYYLDHEDMISPILARRYLHKHFNYVKYRTFSSKVRYRDQHLDRINPTPLLKFIYYISPVLARVEKIPVLGWLLEMLYSHSAYICQGPKDNK